MYKLIIFVPEIHQQMHKSLKRVQSALYYSRTLHMFRLSMSHHQGLSNSASQMLDRPIIDIRKIFVHLFSDFCICFCISGILKMNGDLRLKILII
jgi:hypothetical protein